MVTGEQALGRKERGAGRLGAGFLAQPPIQKHPFPSHARMATVGPEGGTRMFGRSSLCVWQNKTRFDKQKVIG